VRDGSGLSVEEVIGVQAQPLRTSRLAPALLALFLLPFASAPAARQSQAVFHSTTEMVRLDLRVADAHGRPVTDLSADEVEVTENGQRRPVLLFRHLSDEHGLTLVHAAEGEPTTNAVQTPGHIYVLVFDQSHLEPGHDQRARLAAGRFIERETKPGDAVALYGLPGPGPLVGLTTDMARVRSALAGVHGSQARLARTRYVAGDDPIADAVNGVEPGQSLMGMAGPAGAVTSSAVERATLASGGADAMSVQADTESEMFLSSLARLMRSMRWIEGRKNVILFSDGFPADHLVARLEQVSAAAADSYSVVYSLDLDTGGIGPGPATHAGVPSAVDFSARRMPLASLALETDGRFVPGADAERLRQALDTIATEAEDYYLVGFEAGEREGASAYQRVKVRVKRPGVVVHARTGYSTPAETSPALERDSIDAALMSPRICRALPIEYATYERAASTPDRARVIISATAHLRRFASGESAKLVFVVRDAASGAAVASGSDEVRPDGGGVGAGELVDVPYLVQFEVPPGEYRMRVLVRDPGGVIGTADRLFRVWPLTGEGLATSDLIVARLDGRGFDPPCRAVVRSDDPVLAYVEVYGRSSTLDSAAARVDVLGENAEQVLASTEAVMGNGTHGERIARARLPIAGLSAGRYRARIRVTADGQAPRTVFRTFDVVTVKKRQ
jgi:VWFA-related protein